MDGRGTQSERRRRSVAKADAGFEPKTAGEMGRWVGRGGQERITRYAVGPLEWTAAPRVVVPH